MASHPEHERLRFWSRHEREAILRDTLEPARFYAVRHAMAQARWQAKAQAEAQADARHWYNLASSYREILREHGIDAKWSPMPPAPREWPHSPTDEEVSALLAEIDAKIAGRP